MHVYKSFVDPPKPRKLVNTYYLLRYEWNLKIDNVLIP